MFDIIKNTTDVFTQTINQPWVGLGDVLLVGEGNLSFSKSLLIRPNTGIRSLYATTFESAKMLSSEATAHSNFLKSQGCIVDHDVDAMRLDKKLNDIKFDTIIFQFPNVGSRNPKYGHNPNHVLVRRFLVSAAEFLKPSGRVIISAVDNSYYNGLFKFDEAAEFSDYKKPENYVFKPHEFKEYSHLNTNDDDSALEDYNSFSSWVFRKNDKTTI